MFRIHFDHRSGQFVVQVLRFGLLWRTVCNEISGDNGQSNSPSSFPTYAETREWIEKIGLDKLYSEQHPDRSFNQFVLNGGRP